MSTQQTRYTLPNGLVVQQTDVTQAKLLYAEIFEEEIYLQHGIVLCDNDCVFDVGANVGFFSLYIHQKCKNTNIYAFEPIPTTFSKLKANIENNRVEAKLFACGLSNINADLQFLSFPRLNMLSGLFTLEEAEQFMGSFLREALPEKRQEAITSIKLDDRIRNYLLKAEPCICPVKRLSTIIQLENIDHIDLLKIDVEKSEYDVLMGIEEHDWSKIKQIVLEVHGKDILQQVVPLLEKNGYSLHVEEIMVLVENDRVKQERKIYMVYAHE